MKDIFADIKKRLAVQRSLCYFDIETRPLKFWGWQTGKQYVTSEQICEDSKVISIQWMLEGDKHVSYDTWDHNHDDKKLLENFSKTFKGVQVAVSQNGRNFDHKVLTWRLNVHKLPPLDQVTMFDTLSLSRSTFRMASHKLDYRSKVYGLGGKLRMHLPDWIDVVERKPGSLEKMLKYGCKDIEDLRGIFWRELPYYKNIPVALTLLLYPKETKVREFCPRCAHAKQSKFKIIPVNKCNKVFWSCERCRASWEGKP